MNEPQTRTARIIGWLKKPKFWLDFVLLTLAIALAIVSAVLALSTVYEGLSVRLKAIAGGLVAAAVLFPFIRRIVTTEKALDQTNKPKIRIDRITDWLLKPMLWLSFALLVFIIATRIGSVVFSFFPCYKELSAWLIAIVGGLVATAVLFPIARRVSAAGKAVDQTNKPQTRIDRIIDWPMEQKLLLGFAIAIAISSAILSLCPGDYKGLSARLMAIAGGSLAVAVLLQTMKRANAAEKAVDQTKESIVQRTFSDAITHLGHGSESVILGGIHSLLDLAKKNSDYRPRVLNILCTHIKTTTATEEYRSACRRRIPEKQIKTITAKEEDRNEYEEKPSTTIQILLTLLFIDKEYDIFTVDQANYRADLSGAYLVGSYLSKARLQGINLSGAQLQEARLWGAQLQKADLKEAQLQGALLSGAHLQEAHLIDAKLQGALLSNAQLQKARLWEAQLQEADLSKAQLQGAFLTGAKLQGADLEKAQLQGAHLWGTQLQGADLKEAQLQGADLKEAQMQGADLREAKFQGAILQQAEMQGAYMHQTELSDDTGMHGSDLRGVSSHEDEPPMKFQERIRSRKRKKAKLSGVVFNGVVSKGPNPDLAAFLKRSEAKTGSYTKEEADRWIKEYEKALDWKKRKD